MKTVIDGIAKSFLSNEFEEKRFESWTSDNHYAIFAETGAGKSTLLLDKFTSWTEKQIPMKKILYLYNRKSMYEQFAKKYEQEHVNLTTSTYQDIEARAKGIGVKDYIDSFDYILCDECHYFVSDAAFNENTFLSYEAINNCNGTAIYITGTPHYFMKMVNKLHKPLKILREVNHSNNNVKTISVIRSKQVIQDMQLKALNEGSKVVSFSNWISILQRMKEAAKEFKTAILMAEENDKAYLMDLKVKNTIENSTDENGNDISNVFVDYLGCTSAYENGINFNIEGSVTVAFPTYINWTSLEQSRSRVRYFKNTIINMLVRIPHGITLNNLEAKYKKEIKEIKEIQTKKPKKEDMPFGYEIYNKYNDFALAYKDIQLHEVQKMKTVDNLIEYFKEKLHEFYPNAEIEVIDSNDLIDIDSVIEEFIGDNEEINLIDIEDKERFINAINEVYKDKEHTGRKLKLNKISKIMKELNSTYSLIKLPSPVKIKNAEGKATTTTVWKILIKHLKKIK